MGDLAGHVLDGLVDHAQDQLTLIASPEAGRDGLIGHHPGGHGGNVGLVLGHDGHVHGGSGGHVLAGLVLGRDDLEHIGSGGCKGLVLGGGHNGHIHGGLARHVVDGLIDHTQGQLTLFDSPEAGCDKLIGQPSVGHGPIVVPSDPPCV